MFAWQANMDITQFIVDAYACNNVCGILHDVEVATLLKLLVNFNPQKWVKFTATHITQFVGYFIHYSMR